MLDLDTLPRPAERRLAVRIKPAAERQLRQGHPWLFAGSVESISHEGRPGDLAVIFDRRRRFLAIGLYDPTSPIRVRVLQHNRPAKIDEGWFRERIAMALAGRDALASDELTTGYRLIHGENDGLPGLVVDRYADILVVRLDSVGWVAHMAVLVNLLVEQVAPAAIILRLSRNSTAQVAYLHGLTDGALIYGKLPEPPILFHENGFLLEVDPVNGQKTGYFLDQRDNRAYVESVAAGRHVLDVFTYHGSFALHAARGGAHSVLTIDQSHPAIAVAQRNFRRNRRQAGRRATGYETLVGDAFKTLARLERTGRQFDLVILDPPAFAQREADVPGALVAYRRLVSAGLAVLAPAGILLAASCSSRVSADQFFELVRHVVAASQPAYQNLYESQHALDHPIGFPEGAYLKCIAIELPA